MSLDKSNINFLEKITIIIYSYNKHKYLIRSINYWLNYNIKLLILDGSSVKLDDSCLQSKNIKYVHDTRGVYDRFLSSINYIDTEFVILCCDDEFYLPSAISSCIEFLTKEITYSNCQGLAIGFGTRKKGKEVYGFQQYLEFRDWSLDHDSALERIAQHFSNYTPAHVYSVTRFSTWKIICKHIFEKKYNFCGMFELQIEFLRMVPGKSKIIKELMWMRNNEVPETSMGGKFSASKIITMLEWWHEKRCEKEKEDFLYRMKKACDELSIDDHSKFTKDLVAKLFEFYLKRQHSKKSFLVKGNNFIKSLIKNLIKPILPWHEIRTKKYRSLEQESYKLEDAGYIVNQKEVSQIISFLKKNPI
jgi:glycosyltransferase domain-containing protein